MRSTYKGRQMATASSSTFANEGNELGGDEDENSSSKWSNTTTCLNYSNIKSESYNFLNDDDRPNAADTETENIFEFDFRMHNNDAILSDFASLLNDGEDDMLAANAAEVENNDMRMSKLKNAAGGSLAGVSTATKTDRVQCSQSSQQIGSIMSDHDYLSREDTLSILASQEYREPMEDEPMDEEPPTEPMSQTPSSILNSSPSEIIPETEENTVKTEPMDDPILQAEPIISTTLPGIIKKLSDKHITSVDLINLADELKKRANEFVAMLNAEEGDSSAQVSDSGNPVARAAIQVENNLVDSSSQTNESSSREIRGKSKEAETPEGGIRDDRKTLETLASQESYTFSRDHSEPLEYYGDLFGSEAILSQPTEGEDKENDVNRETGTSFVLSQSLSKITGRMEKLLLLDL